MDLVTPTASTSDTVLTTSGSFTLPPISDLTAEADGADSLPMISAPSSCRKRLRLSSSGGSTNETLDSITAYMLAKEKVVGAGAPVSECEVFGHHMANEMNIIKTLGIRKRIQLEIMSLVYAAQLENGVI